MIYSIVKDPLGDYLQITHGSNKVEFEVASLIGKNNNTETMFLTVNKFLDTLNAYKRNALFEVLSEFYVFKNKNVNYNAAATVDYLESVINRIVEIVPVEEVKPWLVWKQSDVMLPSNLEDEFTYDPDMNVTEEKTYIKSQYLALVSVLQVLKICLPVFGEYNSYMKEVSSQSLHKTFLLLVNTRIYNTEEMTKLRVYTDEIQNTVKSQESSKVEQFIINKGLCSDDITDNILAEIFLNKLMNADLYNPKSNIISVIFQTIKSKSNPTTSESDIIRMRAEVGSNGEDISFFEDYRKTTDIPLGTVVEIQYAMGEVGKIVKCLGVEEYFSEEFYARELVHSKDMLDYSLDDTQIYLLGWFLSKYDDPRSLFYIEAMKVVELLTLARVVLWNRGHHFISLLMTSCKGNGEASTMNISSKTTLSPEMQDALSKKYSFFYSKEARDNEIEEAILAILDRIQNCTWFTNADINDVLAYNKDSRKGNRKLSIPSNLADVLAAYILTT
jgi:hypothetical protein